MMRFFQFPLVVAKRKANGFYGLFVVAILLVLHSQSLAQAPTPVSQGQATNEIDQWTAQIRDNRQQIETVQKKVSGLAPVLRKGSDRMAVGLDKAKKDPTGQRGGLMDSTIEVLDDVSQAVAGIVAEKESTLIQATQVEELARAQSGEFRAEAEKVDQTIPARESELATMRAEANAKKDQFLKNPTNRDLKRELRRYWDNQRDLEADIEADKLNIRVFTAAAEGLIEKAEELENIHDGLEDTFGNLESFQKRCQGNAKLLRRVRDVEGRITAFGGKIEIATLMKDVGNLRSLTADINQVADGVLKELAKRQPPTGGGGPPPVFDTDFNRWLNERK